MQKITLPASPKYIEFGKNTGKIEIDGCYPGYGTTLGNSLRRVLLSSLPGAAAVSVKIKGVSHEFSTVPGVLEDVIQIILNLKKVRFLLHGDEPVKLTLKEKGAKKISAAQIQCPSNVEVISKDFPIATITDKKGELEMEIEVQKGLGYVPVEQQEREKKEIGLIAIDAVFTPVRRVNYTVENTRVGKRTDYDKIVLEIETDGSVTPKAAFQLAVETTIEQFVAIKDFEVETTAAPVEKKDAEVSLPEAEKAVVKSDDKGIPVESLSFSTRTMNVLEKSHIRTVEDLIAMTEDELMNVEGMGEKGIKEIKKAVGNFGLTLKS